MTRAHTDSAALRPPSRAVERGAAGRAPPPATFTPFADRFIAANAEWPGVMMAMNREAAEQSRPARGMPVAPELTPVQRLAQRKPGIPGRDSYASRPDDAPLSPQSNLRPPVFDLRWLGWSSLIVAVPAIITAWWLA